MPTVNKGVETGWNSEFDKFIAEVEAQGGSITVNSGKRSAEKQADMIKNPSKYGIAPGTPIAKPGKSDHQHGNALDLQMDAKTKAIARKIAPKYGIFNNIANDPVHWYIPRNKAAAGSYSPGVDVADGTGEVVREAEPMSLDQRMDVLASMLNPDGIRPDTNVDTSAAVSGVSSPVDDATLQPSPINVEPDQMTPGKMSGGGAAAGQFADLFNEAGKKYGVDPRLLSMIAKAESGYNPSAKNPSGATGLMQLMPGTAKGLGVNASDPKQAVDGAARMMAGLIKQFGSVELALAAYNAGPGNVKKYGGIPPFKETQAYVKKIMGAMSNG